jgi:phosphoglycerate dehydrogenase-like enzyme
MRVVAFDAMMDRAHAAFAEAGVAFQGLDELLARADVVSLHVPLVESTRKLFDARRMAAMKPGAVLINTARGGIVDEAALKAALIEGRLAGAACDVYAIEPPVDRELLLLPNFVGTPHIGGSTEEAALAMGRAAITGLGDPARQIS